MQSRSDVEAALEVMDANRSGDVSLSEFKAWWKTSRVVFTVKRDLGMPGHVLRDVKAFGCSKPKPSPPPPPNRLVRRAEHLILTGDQKRALKEEGLEPGPLRITAYTGDSKRPVIDGLAPNTLYRLQLTLRTNICCSLPSTVVPVMTAPNKVRDPGLVLVARGARWVRLAWYGNFSGAHRYVVELLKEKAGDTKQEWKPVWHGQETTATIADLADKSKYFFRVFACNAFGGRSVPAYMSAVPNTKVASLTRLRVGRIVGVHTMSQKAFAKTKYGTAVGDELLEQFPIKCPSDIIPGDEVLCCLGRRVKRGEVMTRVHIPDRPALMKDMADVQWLCTVTAVVTASKWRKRKGTSTRSTSTSTTSSGHTSRHPMMQHRNMDRLLVLDVVSASKPVPSTGHAHRHFMKEVRSVFGLVGLTSSLLCFVHHHTQRVLYIHTSI